ncbi:transmembrane emp24 domain-containing protein p24delta3-like [Tripterygium wilfordii]|uniref:Transmembrane emp24 domain-containing protein p24delta3-like n=1 Tax=Tripterygium wilfordii TaxID=458696 RepID=A0A7J7DC54_TRIWF|nr:transmembrane emp24 domain-containing protein p24delta3-like [Tripterygium wilfordii]KAF5743913.1 transmembrane emp24 domain-containing protein p24delta3-like [Tripterygium wilfordii]
MGLRYNVRREVVAVLLTLWIWTDIQGGEAIWLTVPPTGTKCVSEEIHSNVVVLADYVVVSDEHSRIPTISVKVTSPYGNSLHHVENVTHGQFAFTTQEAGNYLACLWAEGHNQGGGEVSVNLDWKTGIAAKDWESVARKEKIEGIELELRKLEGAVEAIHENLIYLKSREADMRIVSETTNGRVAWFSFMSLGVCIGVSALQVLYLKQFFQKKKLI